MYALKSDENGLVKSGCGLVSDLANAIPTEMHKFIENIVPAIIDILRVSCSSNC
jgi:hypothetical protein